jgi:hypothetical protein
MVLQTCRMRLRRCPRVVCVACSHDTLERRERAEELGPSPESDEALDKLILLRAARVDAAAAGDLRLLS